MTGALTEFIRSVGESFLLEWGDNSLRFYQNHAQVLSGGMPYEISTPYSAADLYDANGFFQLNFVQSADVVYITHRSKTIPVYKLSHFGTTNWTLTKVTFLGGPFADQNPNDNPCVFADAKTGDVTLTSSADIFDPLICDSTGSAGDGAFFQLTQFNIRNSRPWEADVLINKGQIRRNNGATYEAMNGDGSTTKTGTVAPIHLTGEQWDGGGTGQGIRWRYLDPGYGFVQLIARGTDPTGVAAVITNITAAKPPVVTLSTAPVFANDDLIFIKDVVGMTEVNNTFYRVKNISGNTFQLFQDDTDGDGTNGPVDGNNWTAYGSDGTADNRLWTCSAEVIVQNQAGITNRLPGTVVNSHNATPLWAVGDWNNRDGYPTSVAFFRGRLCFGREGIVNISVAQDFENFAALTPNAQQTPDMAIRITVPTQDDTKWLVDGRVLVVGNESAEHSVQEINPSTALAAENIKTQKQLTHGSRAVRPVVVGGGAGQGGVSAGGATLMFAQTSGLKLLGIKYAFYTDNYESQDLTALAEHITKGGLMALAYQQEPDSVVWCLKQQPPEGDPIFATDQNGATIQIFDNDLNSLGAISGASTLLSVPKGMIVAAGLLWVADTGLAQILAFDSTQMGDIAPTRKLLGGSTTLSGPTDVAVGLTSGKIFVADGTVKIYAANAASGDAPIATIGGASNPIAAISVALDAAENVYVVDGNQLDRVLVYKNGTVGDVAPDVTITDGSSTLADANNVRVDANGNVWVSDTSLGMFKFPPIGAGSGTISPMPSAKLTNSLLGTGADVGGPVGITFDSDGNSYILTLNLVGGSGPAPLPGTVYKFDATANGTDAPIATGPLTPPDSAQGGGIACTGSTARNDLIGLTFKEQESVTGWHRHPFGGTNPSIESIACAPAPDGSQDELWMIVARKINGVTKRYVEYMAPHFLNGDSLVTDAHYADASATYTGAPTMTVTGLGYLEGETVGVLADGASHPDCVVSGGQITLTRLASVVDVGIRQASKLTTMPLEFQTPGGTAQGKKKRIVNINVRLLNTLGGKFGREDTQDAANSQYDDVEVRAPADPMDVALGVINGFWPPDTYDFPWPAAYEQEGRLTYINDTMFPATIVGIYPEVIRVRIETANAGAHGSTRCSGCVGCSRDYRDRSVISRG